MSLKLLLRVFQGAALAVVLVATLHRAGSEMPDGFRFCLICGDIGTAEAVMNVVLFVPWGTALGLGGWRGWRLGAAGFGLSFIVEMLQLGIPGRDPSLSDLVTNTTGTLVGGWVAATASVWLAPPRRVAQRLAAGGAACAVLVLLGTAWLFTPAPPRGPYEVRWRPDMPRIPWYRGSRVLGAVLGDTRLAHEMTLPAADVARLLAGEARLVVRYVAARPPGGFAPIVGILAGPEEGVVLIGPTGDDLSLWVRQRATAWRFDQPLLRAAGLLRGVREGDTVTVAAWREGSGWCLARDTAWHCQLRQSPAQGWALLLYPDSKPEWMRRVASIAWIVVLVSPGAYWGWWAVRGARR